jgi:hypothetical protein
VLSGVASAQAVNPSKFLWEAPDHAITTRYEVGYFLAGATNPVQTASIPVASVAAVGESYETAVPRPVLGSFTAKLKACGAAAGGGEVCSDWSNATDPFSLSPRGIAGLRLVP